MSNLVTRFWSTTEQPFLKKKCYFLYFSFLQFSISFYYIAPLFPYFYTIGLQIAVQYIHKGQASMKNSAKARTANNSEFQYNKLTPFLTVKTGRSLSISKSECPTPDRSERSELKKDIFSQIYGNAHIYQQGTAHMLLKKTRPPEVGRGGGGCLIFNLIQIHLQFIHIPDNLKNRKPHLQH